MTTLRDDITDTLKDNPTPDALFSIVLRHKKAGMSQQTAYDILEGIWIELGCNQADDCMSDSLVCDLLGGLIDRVWGYCPPKESIWDTSLSGEKK